MTIHITIDHNGSFGRIDYMIFATENYGDKFWEGHAHQRMGLSATRGLGSEYRWTRDASGAIKFETEQEALVAAFLDCLVHSGKDVGEDAAMFRNYTLADAMREVASKPATPDAASGDGGGGQG